MSRIWRWLRLLGLQSCLLIGLTGCGSVALFDQIAESDANEMLAALGKAGIVAEKDKRSADGWRILVPSGDVSAALEILGSAGLPRERFRNIGELFPKEGLISTPMEEHMRTLYAVSQELGHTISSIDGVIQARVHLNIPQKDALLRVPAKPTASVFVKYRAEANMQQNILAIKDLVVGAVRELDHAHVTVSLFPWSPQSAINTSIDYVQVMGVSVSPRSYSRLMWLVSVPWLILGVLLAGGLVFTWWWLEGRLIGRGRRLRWLPWRAERNG